MKFFPGVTNGLDRVSRAPVSGGKCHELPAAQQSWTWKSTHTGVDRAQGWAGAERCVGFFPDLLGAHPPSTEGMQTVRRGCSQVSKVDLGKVLSRFCS